VNNSGLKKVHPNGLAARVFLSFLTTAGLFYVNIMPALVNGLIEALGFSNREAGIVGSANVYGAACGALVIVFLIHQLRWKTVAYRLLLVLISLDLISVSLQTPESLTIMRFVHGFVGGMLVGIGFAICARTVNADRTFGMLLFVQFGLGGVGVMTLPLLVPIFGIGVLFLTLVAFSLVTLLMLPFLPEYTIEQPEQNEDDRNAVSIRPPTKLLVLTFIGIFLFQAANMGLYAYIIGLAKFYGLDMAFISPTLGIAAWVGMAGALLVIVMSTRYGRLVPICVGMVLTLLGTWALYYSDIKTIFFLANCGVGITWAFVLPYLFGMCSEFDSRGRMAALGGFVSKMGLASGPLAAAFLLGSNNYELIIDVALVALVVGLIASILPSAVLDRETPDTT